jgi:hypothetical protein
MDLRYSKYRLSRYIKNGKEENLPEDVENFYNIINDNDSIIQGKFGDLCVFCNDPASKNYFTINIKDSVQVSNCYVYCCENCENKIKELNTVLYNNLLKEEGSYNRLIPRSLSYFLDTGKLNETYITYKGYEKDNFCVFCETTDNRETFKSFQAPVGQFNIVHSSRSICKKCNYILNKRKKLLEDKLILGFCGECGSEYYFNESSFQFRIGMKINQYLEFQYNGLPPVNDPRNSNEIKEDVERACSEHLCLTCASEKGYENADLYIKLTCEQCLQETKFDVTNIHFHAMKNHRYICDFCTVKNKTKALPSAKKPDIIDTHFGYKDGLDEQEMIAERIKDLENNFQDIGDMENISKFLYRHFLKDISEYCYCIRLYNKQYYTYSVEKKIIYQDYIDSINYRDLEYYFIDDNKDFIWVVLEDGLVNSSLFDLDIISLYNCHEEAYLSTVKWIDYYIDKHVKERLLDKPTY